VNLGSVNGTYTIASSSGNAYQCTGRLVGN
jgi:hypothetical protein